MANNLKKIRRRKSEVNRKREIVDERAKLARINNGKSIVLQFFDALLQVQIFAFQFVNLLLRLSEILLQFAFLGFQLILGLLGIIAQLLIPVHLGLRSYDAVLQGVQLLFGLLQLKFILVDHLIVVFWLGRKRGFLVSLIRTSDSEEKLKRETYFDSQ